MDAPTRDAIEAHLAAMRSANPDPRVSSADILAALGIPAAEQHDGLKRMIKPSMRALQWSQVCEKRDGHSVKLWRYDPRGLYRLGPLKGP